MHFYNCTEYAYLEESEDFSPLKILSGRQFSLQKLTQYSHGNNVLDVPPSNIDGFLSIYTCFFNSAE
jgi:hypothetical protein